MPKKSLLRTIAQAAFTLGVVAACSEDEAPPPPLPQGPPDLRIVSLDAPGMHTGIDDGGLGGCFPVGEDSNRACDSSVSGAGCGFVVVLKTNPKNKQIPLELPDGSQPRSWTFQPPLGCRGAPDCGYALLLIDPKSEPCAARPEAAVTKIAAGPVISLDFAELQSGLNGAFGRKTIRVELWPGEGVPDKDHCRSTQVEVDFELTCGQSDGGTRDARTDAPSPESGLPDAPAPPPDASGASIDGTLPDATLPDATRTDAADASSPSDSGAESG